MERKEIKFSQITQIYWVNRLLNLKDNNIIPIKKGRLGLHILPNLEEHRKQKQGKYVLVLNEWGKTRSGIGYSTYVFYHSRTKQVNFMRETILKIEKSLLGLNICC